MMRIGIDIDEVIVEFLQSYLKMHNKINNSNYAKNDFFSYCFEEILPESKEFCVELAMKFYEMPEFEKLNFVEGAKETINKLSGVHELFFITARPEEVKESTVGFFKKYFPDLEAEILFSGDFYGGNKNKSELCLETGVEVFVEDDPKYALSCAEKGIKILLMDKPWNKNCEHENILRVKNWNEILEGLDEHTTIF